MFFKGFWTSPAAGEPGAALADMAAYAATDVWLLTLDAGEETLRAWGRAAREAGLRLHAWVVVNHALGANRDLAASHPEWVAVRRDGKSCLEEPFAGNQVWWCPTAAERLEAVLPRWERVLEASQATGLHLDYIRYPDTFSFQMSPLSDRREVPEQSYCYCDRCRELFREETGLDPREVPLDESYPEARAWQAFRQRQVTRQVERIRSWLDPSLLLSAAVFPTPSIARRDVLQDWADFSRFLDHVCPMIYARRYWGRPMSWAEEAAREGRREMAPSCRYYAGLGPLYASLEPGDIREGVLAARRGGADGALLFSFPPKEAWQREELAAVLRELERGG